MEKTTAIEPAIAPATAPSAATVEDMEAKYAALEAEKAKALEIADNYKTAYLKEKGKHKENFDEDEEDKMRRIAQETLANSRLVEIAREQDALIQKALKENKELKLAQLNKPTVPAAVGAHSEGQPVTDTLVTPEQMAHFKSQGWDDAKIERYKANLRRNPR